MRNLLSGQRPQTILWHQVHIESGFWAERQKTNRESTIPAVYHQTKITGRIDAWKIDWKPGQPHMPHIFWDSDTAKWIEAVGYSVATHPNPEFEQQVDEVVDMMEKAQLPDGYANSHFITVEPQNRWRNLRDEHELYCAGHLIEAAVTYSQTTGKSKMLDVLRRYADHIDTTFGPGDVQKHGYPGHPELELALVRLYRATNEPRYLELSKYFIDERGQQPHYYDLEAVARGENPRKYWARNYEYSQSQEPIRQQTRVKGHSVRAQYLYAAATDIALETGDTELFVVVRRLWDDMIQRQLYVTGGVGAIHTIEGFYTPYDLPNETAYSETCSSIALIYWAQRLFDVEQDGRYIDALERALYNCVMSGVSYDGTLFFQCNTLERYPHVSPYGWLDAMSDATYHERQEWFEVSCCPPNIVRLVASLGNYFYSVTPERLYVHLYNQNRTQVLVGGSTVQVEQVTNYPWDGEISLTLTPEQPAHFQLALRIPRWCREYRAAVNGEAIDGTPERGYLLVEREWQRGDVVTLVLAMPVERIVAHPRIRQDAGCVALQRGPVVYCLEAVDNGVGLAHVTLPRTSALAYAFDDNLFGGVGTIRGEAVRLEPAAWVGEPYQPESQQQVTPTPFTFRAIPYCFWANRAPGEMRVWIREA
jgi:DUF1680 family protein